MILIEPIFGASGLKEFADQLDCSSLQHIKHEPSPHADVGKHHMNVAEYITSYGGERATGFLFYHMPVIDEYVAMHHTVWKHADQLIDITPHQPLRHSTIFGESRQLIGYNSALLSEINSNLSTSYTVYVVRDRTNKEILLTGLLKNFNSSMHPLWHVLESCDPEMSQRLEHMRDNNNIPEMITVLPNVKGPTKAETIVSKLSQHYKAKACYSYFY